MSPPTSLRLARQVGARRVQLLADQRVVAGHDEERQLVHLAVPATWIAPVAKPVSASSSDSAKNDPMKMFAAGLSRSMMPVTAAT